MSKPLSHLNSNQVAHVAIARSDITAFIENSVPLAIMHRSLSSLEQCMSASKMQRCELKGISSKDALLFVGDYCGNKALPLEALWVRAKSHKYRDAFHAKHQRANNTTAPSDLHADHIVHRASLKQIYERHDPWVMIFETPASANSGVGSKIEKFLPLIPDHVTQVFLAPLHAFKLFATDIPKTKIEFDQVMASIDGQILTKDFVAEIKNEIEKCCVFR